MSNEEREKRLAEKMGFTIYVSGTGIEFTIPNGKSKNYAYPAQAETRALWNECLRLMAQAEEAQNALRQVLDVVPRPLQGNSHQFWTMYEAVEKAYETGREITLPEGERRPSNA